MEVHSLSLQTPEYDVLRTVVSDYPGLVAPAEHLIFLIGEDPRNWQSLLQEIKAYALKNFYLHDHHEAGDRAMKVVAEILAEALSVPDQDIRKTAVDTLIFYLEKILLDGVRPFASYAHVFRLCAETLLELQDEVFFLFVCAIRHLRKTGALLLEKNASDTDLFLFSRVLSRDLAMTYAYWLNREGAFSLFRKRCRATLEGHELAEIEALFSPISPANIAACAERAVTASALPDARERMREILALPGYLQIVRFHEDLAAIFTKRGASSSNLLVKTSYLLAVLANPGLFAVHESSIRDLSRTLCAFIKGGWNEPVRAVVEECMETLKSHIPDYPDTVLSSVQNIGMEIVQTGDSKLTEWYYRTIIGMGFRHASIEGVSREWHIRGNKGHLKNIRTYLALIGQKPKWAKALISALIINLRLGGVQINDTDLFQKDVTQLLNADIRPVYHLVKQLTRVYPVYFNVINAEGPIREVSTEIDEMTGRADPLVHFLRKQVHVESSARTVDFIEAAITYWLSGDKQVLVRYLSDEFYTRIGPAGELYDGMHAVFTFVMESCGLRTVKDLLGLPEEEFRETAGRLTLVSEKERRRAFLSYRLYLLLDRKYTLAPKNIREFLSYAQHLGLPAADGLIAILEKGSLPQRLDAVLSYLKQLQDIILSAEQFAAVEDVFRKRHIAVGVPSMYGRYLEKKFDALSLTFRLESVANSLFDELVSSLNLDFITRATLMEIEGYAALFSRALQLDGIGSHRFTTAIELLSGTLGVRRFSASQYIDIFRGLAEAVQDILSTYCHDIHRENLRTIIPAIGRDTLLPNYSEQTFAHHEDFINNISEKFLRDMVTMSFGLQQLDNFVSKILRTLHEQTKVLDAETLDLLMSYDPKKALSDIHEPAGLTGDRIHLGNKGYNLVKLANLGIPVPPGFIVTTEVFRCLPAITAFRNAGEHLNTGIRARMTNLEQATGRTFGDPGNPLLVSVRSGGAVSMPGMMISLLNVGINEKIIHGLIRMKGKPWFAWDCYRRFLQSWGMSFGIERDRFDTIIDTFKTKEGVARKIQFSPGQMQDLALIYRQTVEEHGIRVPDDPNEQLETAISLVFRSWHSKTARSYREILGISENWGTAVIVQAMVYGNLDTESGTGVLFSHNPRGSKDTVVLWGDYSPGTQGEDIVSGLVETLPISNEQMEKEERSAGASLESSFPENYAALLRNVKRLIYEERWGAQEIEFTFEGRQPENLFLLQARDMAVRRVESFSAFLPTTDLSVCHRSSGIGVGGGAMSGRAVFTSEAIEHYRRMEPDTNLILIRSDTVPDDISLISAADGLLTARGGSASHAAIVTHSLGKTCVVGCNKLKVQEWEGIARLDGWIIREGDYLSIDGRHGAVYSGRHAIREIRTPGD